MNIIETFMNDRNNPINNLILKSMPALLILSAVWLAPPTAKGFAAERNSFVLAEEIGADDKDFKEGFREGRDLIDKEEWAQAAKKFSELVAKFPDNKSADAALYWLAFCYKKQKMYREADAALDRLLEKFPASSWANDARVMKLEIAAPLGKWNRANVVVGSTATLPAGVYATTLPRTTTGVTAVTPATPVTTTAPVAKSFEGLTVYGEINAAAETPLDREDEIKIAAFQSLLSADAKRGIEAMSGILAPDSKASETLKIEVLRAIRRPRVGGNYAAQSLTFTSTAGSLDKESVPLLREILTKSFKEEKNAKIRKEIIYTLAGLKDASSVDYLARLYQSETDREVKRAIINGFGSLAGIGGFSVARLSETTSNTNSNAIVSNGGARDETKGAEFAKLLEIVKTERDAELKTLAFNNLQRFDNWSADAKIVDALIQIYDAETSEDFKKSLVQSFGKIKQAPALRKLFEIAKNDKSDKLRLEAIYALRNSKDPAALKFLEELIK